MKSTRVGPPPRRRTVLAAALLPVLLPAAAPASDASARRRPATAPALPAPTGPHPVGLRTLSLRDTSRRDPWDPGRFRDLMISLRYPARYRTLARARYVTARESAAILRRYGIDDVPADLLRRTRVHTGGDAPPLPVTGRGLPLVLLSPGFTLPRSSLTALAEDLASRGYAVAAVDHAHEAAAITYPGGRVTGCRACRPAPDGAHVAVNRAADLSFVRRELTERPAGTGGRAPGTWPLPRLDPSRVAVLGHSMGGAAAFEALHADRAFAAGANLDGTFHTAGTASLDRPFLLLGSQEHGRPGADGTWDSAWRRLSGWRRWYSMADTGHVSFTDYGVLSRQLGRAVPGAPDDPAAAQDALRLTCRLVAAFLDERLRGIGPSLTDAFVHGEMRLHRHGVRAG